jgi:alpha-beta hydrolase superfamily lysophospholipase
MQSFERDLLINGLPLYLEAPKGISSDQVGFYLEYYRLFELLERSTYRIGRIVLDDIPVTVQSFSQKESENARGTVIVVHGYMDHVGLYKYLIDMLLTSRFDVLCYDLTGHGLSAGDALSVGDFKHYATQLAELISTLKGELVSPLHLVGQSTGAAVVMAHQLLFSTKQSSVSGSRILLAPLVRPSSWSSIQRKFRWLKYVVSKVPRRYSVNSHDVEFRQFISEQDPLQHKEIPVSWIGAMLAWGDWVENHKPVFGQIHMVQGTDDATVDWHHNMAVLGRLYPELELTLIDDAKHHLVNESTFYRLQVFNRLRDIFQQWENKNGRP